MITFIDPRGSSTTEIEPYSLSVDVSAKQGAGLCIALLANGFPDSETFVRKLGESLKARLPAIQTRLWNKGNAGVVISDDMLEEVIASCQLAVAAYGH